MASETDPLPNDVACWNRFRQNDDVALGHLMQRYYSALYQYGCSFSNRPDLVDDTIQDLFYSFWQRRHQLPDVIYVKTYLLTALRNRLVDNLRKPNRVLFHADLATAASDAFAGTFLIEQPMVDEESQQEQTRQLQALVGQLSKRQREAIYLRFYQDLDNDAIASLMQVNRQSVANLISTALLRLRQNWRTVISLLMPLLSPFSIFLKNFSV